MSLEKLVGELLFWPGLKETRGNVTLECRDHFKREIQKHCSENLTCEGTLVLSSAPSLPFPPSLFLSLSLCVSHLSVSFPISNIKMVPVHPCTWGIACLAEFPNPFSSYYPIKNLVRTPVSHKQVPEPRPCANTGLLRRAVAVSRALPVVHSLHSSALCHLSPASAHRSYHN